MSKQQHDSWMEQHHPDGDERFAPQTRRGWLHLNSWAGHSKHRVTVLDQMMNGKYRVRWEEKGALSWHQGEIRLVPEYAVTFEQGE